MPSVLLRFTGGPSASDRAPINRSRSPVLVAFTSSPRRTGVSATPKLAKAWVRQRSMSNSSA
eukprot:CAMPEP_0204313356 /NCGR_PEP_ID=MMETSP0469-20131031/3543_1 /ASSEMBLY_ACC=CAM_ASM_000384 /TAXON_ID=2969 /ORGANISM="Oxyrrhis marina" /LENGTH=61 /DNA_ID=CAMNT_0051293633 /DNA_START=73 /DNA_END=255 /DNA_ORIENTATION=-